MLVFEVSTAPLFVLLLRICLACPRCAINVAFGVQRVILYVVVNICIMSTCSLCVKSRRAHAHLPSPFTLTLFHVFVAYRCCCFCHFFFFCCCRLLCFCCLQDWRYRTRRWFSTRPREYVPRRLLPFQPGNDSYVPDIPLNGHNNRCLVPVHEEGVAGVGIRDLKQKCKVGERGKLLTTLDKYGKRKMRAVDALCRDGEGGGRVETRRPGIAVVSA